MLFYIIVQNIILGYCMKHFSFKFFGLLNWIYFFDSTVICCLKVNSFDRIIPNLVSGRINFRG